MRKLEDWRNCGIEEIWNWRTKEDGRRTLEIEGQLLQIIRPLISGFRLLISEF